MTLELFLYLVAFFGMTALVAVLLFLMVRRAYRVGVRVGARRAFVVLRG